MKWLLHKFDGNIELALAAYNAGEGNVVKYGMSVPPFRETQNYVKLIGGQYNRTTRRVEVSGGAKK